MKHLLTTVAVLVGCTSWAEAQTYIGAFGGYSASSTVNPLIVGGSLVGEFPQNGMTTGTLAGLTFGYTNTLGWLTWGVESSVAYDFSRQCFSTDCAVERHSGWLLQQVTELGFVVNGLTVAGRAGVAERTRSSLCAFDLAVLQRDCGTGFAVGPNVGIKFKYIVGKNSDMFVTVDDIAWKGYSTSTPANALLGFQNTATIKNEVVFKLGIDFHL